MSFDGPEPPSGADIVGGKFEQALAAAQRETIGGNWNGFQRDAMDVFAAQYDRDPHGYKNPEKMKNKEGKSVIKNISEFETDSAENYKTDRKTIENYMKSLKPIIEKKPRGDSKKSKTYWMTTDGRIKYQKYIDKKIEIIKAAAEELSRSGLIIIFAVCLIASFVQKTTEQHINTVNKTEYLQIAMDRKTFFDDNLPKSVM
ncbi:hypothetical protein LCM28_25590 [Salipiger pacificus]|nr:hypothetical protein [Alloyangia pacifica]